MRLLSTVRAVCLFTCTVVLLCGLWSVKADDTPADNWSQFRGNHELTGVSQANVPDSLKPLWTYEAGDSIESSAAIVGGTVFIGSQKGELVALSLDNGKVYWKFDTGNPIGESSPAYSNGVVYIGDYGGWLNAVNASDGKKLWAHKANGEIKSSPVVIGDISSPAYSNGVVYIGDYGGWLNAVNASDGKKLWAHKANGEIKSSPVVIGD